MWKYFFTSTYIMKLEGVAGWLTLSLTEVNHEELPIV